MPGAPFFMTCYDLYAIGNALVDIEYEVSDAELHAAGVDKRRMTLIDADRSRALQALLAHKTPRRGGGGSAANTVVALAQLGGKAFYSCQVAQDELGQFFYQDLLASGVVSNLSQGLAKTGQTGSCVVLVTPDAERSMSTHLGASAELDHTSLQPQAIAQAKVYYMEGYLAASPTGLQALLQGRQMAQDAGVALAATLSDVSMINFCRSGLEAIVGQGLDYLFCNQEEAAMWCASQDLQVLARRLGELARVVCLTRGALGCLVLDRDKSTQSAVPAAAVKALDTNGAGDMFAGAFLYAVTQGYSLLQAAWLGNQAAALVVSQFGTRLNQRAMAQLKAQFDRHVQT